MRGSSIECRINAEDPHNEFAPSTGLVSNCSLPYGPGVRVDTYLYPGCTVSGYYDSLVAKLVVWGQDFNEARSRMLSSIDEFTIEGINTTLPLYKTILGEENFIQGNISTDYLEKYGLINRMEEESRNNVAKLGEPSVVAALIQSEFIGSSPETPSQVRSPRRLSNWTRMVGTD